MKTVAFFNNKGGVGKTSLAFHISWMLKKLGHNVLAADFDPQANLTRMCMDESRIEKVLQNKQSAFNALEPLIQGTGDIKNADIYKVTEGFGLLPGSLELSGIEADFSDSWPKCMDGNPRSFRVITAFSRLMKQAGEEWKADWGVIDMGPNLGAINRAVLIASNYVVFPLGPDLFSFQGLKNVGNFLNRWKKEWDDRKDKKPDSLNFALPEGDMVPVGYVMMRHSIRHDRPVQAYQRWMNKMPIAYRKYVLQEREMDTPSEQDQYLLAHLKDYRSLMPMAQEKTKPIFLLKPGDGAIGAHYNAVQECYKDFKSLTKKIISTCEKNTSV
ncbi:MAG: ParA family protein [Oligoflexia bacterium]|nr:ParA family protein [Oligoflexia bacterium]